MDCYLGIDIGGTKTTVGLFDGECGLLEERTFPTEPGRGYGALLNRIGGACGAITAGGRALACGVACPGPLDIPAGRIVATPTMGFTDKPLRRDLSRILDMPVFLENDTNAAAFYESRSGWGKGLHTVVYITVSTGVGCGIVVDGKILDGAASAAGELGHFVVQRDGLPCSCGGSGCLEAYASGTAIAKIASDRRGRGMDAKEVFALAAQGSETERAVVDEAAEYLGYAVAAVYQLLDPDVVVLGGSVTRDYHVFADRLNAAVMKYTQNIPGRAVRIEVSESKNPALLGAACLCRR